MESLVTTNAHILRAIILSDVQRRGHMVVKILSMQGYEMLRVTIKSNHRARKCAVMLVVEFHRTRANIR
jgi:hypothetical protein